MGWFNEKLNDQSKSLVSDLVFAYTERSRLVFRLLSLEPRLTDMQMAVLWIYMVVTMEKACEENQKPEMAETLAQWHSISREFFDTLCQDYVTQMVGSSLKLDVNSTVIQENVSTTIEAMHPQLRTDAGTIIAHLGGNANALASATLAILRSGLTRDQNKSAQKLAASIVASDKSLNAFEREKTQGWLTGFWSAR
jgi:hypothetical protein